MIKLRKLQGIVNASAKQLDVDYPTWAKHIDTKRLDMGEPRDCIVGQLKESFDDDDFELNCLDESRGFYHFGNVDDGKQTNPNIKGSYARPILDRLWKYQVRKRVRHAVQS